MTATIYVYGLEADQTQVIRDVDIDTIEIKHDGSVTLKLRLHLEVKRVTA